MDRQSALRNAVLQRQMFANGGEVRKGNAELIVSDAINSGAKTLRDVMAFFKTNRNVYLQRDINLPPSETSELSPEDTVNLVGNIKRIFERYTSSQQEPERKRFNITRRESPTDMLLPPKVTSAARILGGSLTEEQQAMQALRNKKQKEAEALKNFAQVFPEGGPEGGIGSLASLENVLPKERERKTLSEVMRSGMKLRPEGVRPPLRTYPKISLPRPIITKMVKPQFAKTFFESMGLPPAIEVSREQEGKDSFTDIVPYPQDAPEDAPEDARDSTYDEALPTYYGMPPKQNDIVKKAIENVRNVSIEKLTPKRAVKEKEKAATKTIVKEVIETNPKASTLTQIEQIAKALRPEGDPPKYMSDPKPPKLPSIKKELDESIEKIRKGQPTTEKLLEMITAKTKEISPPPKKDDDWDEPDNIFSRIDPKVMQLMGGRLMQYGGEKTFERGTGLSRVLSEIGSTMIYGIGEQQKIERQQSKIRQKELDRQQKSESEMRRLATQVVTTDVANKANMSLAQLRLLTSTLVNNRREIWKRFFADQRTYFQYKNERERRKQAQNNLSYRLAADLIKAKDTTAYRKMSLIQKQSNAKAKARQIRNAARNNAVLETISGKKPQNFIPRGSIDVIYATDYNFQPKPLTKKRAMNVVLRHMEVSGMGVDPRVLVKRLSGDQVKFLEGTRTQIRAGHSYPTFITEAFGRKPFELRDYGTISNILHVINKLIKKGNLR